MDTDRLEQIAQEFVCRLRDEDPESNDRWLRAVTNDDERYALLYVLGIAVPLDRPWSHLTVWARLDGGLKPHGTHAAAQRHRYHGEPLCDECREAERLRDRNRKRAAYVPRSSTGSSTAVDAA